MDLGSVKMDKDRLDQMLKDLDKIHQEKIELLYDMNLLEEYKKRPPNQEIQYSLVNLLNWIKSDLEAIRGMTHSLADIIHSVAPDK